MGKDNFTIPDNVLKSIKQTQDIIEKIPRMNIPDLKIPNVEVLKSSMPVIKPISPGISNEHWDAIAKQRREELEREIENNENLKNLATYNQQLVNYNQQLVVLNESILKKISTMGNTMDNIKDNIKIGNQDSQEFNQEQTKLLLQLIDIMESEDKKSNLGEFLKGLSGDVAAGVITGYLQYKLGIS